MAAKPNSSPRTVLTRRESSEVTTLVNAPRPSGIPAQPRKAGFSLARNARTPSAKSGPV